MNHFRQIYLKAKKKWQKEQIAGNMGFHTCLKIVIVIVLVQFWIKYI